MGKLMLILLKKEKTARSFSKVTVLFHIPISDENPGTQMSSPAFGVVILVQCYFIVFAFCSRFLTFNFLRGVS